MAKTKFDLGSTLAEALGSVPKSDTEGMEQIVGIDIANIDAAAENFYSMDGIDELAANIELIGLQQPLRVRENPDMPGRYLIVSGHRRRAALWQLFEEDPEKWRRVPCIVEQTAELPEMQELRLIFANSDTRVLSDADQSAQAERVEMLFYKLADKGVKFPGRLRERVAAACKTSSTKVAEWKMIRENLIPYFRESWEAGDLNHTKAYRIAQEPAELQQQLLESCERSRTDITKLPEWAVDQWFIDAKVKASNEKKKNEAPHFDAEAYAAQLAKETYMLRTAIREQWLKNLCGNISRGRLPDNRLEAVDCLKKCYRHAGLFGADMWEYDGRPNGLEIRTPEGRKFFARYTDLFDELSLVAIDELYRRLDADKKQNIPQRAAPENLAELNWSTGAPPREGRYLCLVDMKTSQLHEQKCDYQGGKWFAFGMDLDEMDYTVRAWWPLPPESPFFYLTTADADEEEDDDE